MDFVTNHRITVPINIPTATHSTARARCERRLPRAAFSSACCWASRRARISSCGERPVQLGQRVRLLADDGGVLVDLGVTVGELRLHHILLLAAGIAFDERAGDAAELRLGKGKSGVRESGVGSGGRGTETRRGRFNT